MFTYRKEVTAKGQASLRLGGGWRLAQGHLRLVRSPRLGCGAVGWPPWPHHGGVKAAALPALFMSDRETAKSGCLELKQIFEIPNRGRTSAGRLITGSCRAQPCVFTFSCAPALFKCVSTWQNWETFARVQSSDSTWI